MKTKENIFEIDYLVLLNRQPKGYVLDRQAGTDFYIFLHFISVVTIWNGDEFITTKPNSCIVFTPHSKHYYSATKEFLLHNWFSFSCLDPTYFDKMDVPLNKVFYPNINDVLLNHLSSLEVNILNMPLDYREKTNYYIDQIFNELKSYNYANKTIKLAKENQNMLIKIKEMIDKNPGSLSVEKMAMICHFSTDHFSRLFKNMFNISPQQALFDSKIKHAKFMLCATNLKIFTIADNLGYKTVEPFSRVFKNVTGVSPIIYRKLNSKLT